MAEAAKFPTPPFGLLVGDALKAGEPLAGTPASKSLERAPYSAAPAPGAAPIDLSDEARAPSAEAEAGELEEIRARPAGAFRQMGAFLLDALVLGALFALYLLAAQGIAGRAPASESGGEFLARADALKGVLVPGLVLLAALCFVYSSLFHALGGRTLGKWALGLTVVDMTGQPPGLARSAIRSVLSLVSAALLMLGFALVLFDLKRQSLHDKLTRTFVVRLAD